jgi:hypothetical protein
MLEGPKAEHIEQTLSPLSKAIKVLLHNVIIVGILRKQSQSRH